jgi:hypothetical protein
MKILIQESKLDMLMTEYLNGWVENKSINNLTDFILISQKEANDDDSWVDFMEFDYTDGRLWVNRNLQKFLVDLFGKSQVGTMTFIGKWFEGKFGVEVKYVE